MSAAKSVGLILSASSEILCVSSLKFEFRFLQIRTAILSAQNQNLEVLPNFLDCCRWIVSHRKACVSRTDPFRPDLGVRRGEVFHVQISATMLLTDLPEELLEFVVLEALHSSRLDDKWTLLKRLRLVCKRFRRMHSVLDNLFWKILIIGDPGYLIAENELKNSGIAPYVRHITLVPPVFRKRSFGKFVEAFTSTYNLPCRFNVESGEEAETWKTYERKGAQRTMDQIRKGYREYKAYAIAADEFLKHETAVEAALIPLLRLCSKCSSFRFPAVDYDVLGLDFCPMIPECISPVGRQIDLVRKHQHSANISDVFIKKAVASMVAAGCVVEDLNIGLAQTPRFRPSWMDHLGLSTLDLSQIKSLTIEPIIPLSVWEGDEAGHLEQLREDVKALLESCAPTIEILECRPYGLPWFSGEPVALPKLQGLTFGTCEMGSAFFSAWLSRLPKLEMLYMETPIRLCAGVNAINNDGEPIENWKVVFDAIRDHKQLRQGYVDATIGREELRISWDKDDILAEWAEEANRPNNDLEDLLYHQELYANLSKALDRPDELQGVLDSYCDAHQMAQLYICGKIEWFGMDRFGSVNS